MKNQQDLAPWSQTVTSITINSTLLCSFWKPLPWICNIIEWLRRTCQATGKTKWHHPRYADRKSQKSNSCCVPRSSLGLTSPIPGTISAAWQWLMVIYPDPDNTVLLYTNMLMWGRIFHDTPIYAFSLFSGTMGGSLPFVVFFNQKKWIESYTLVHDVSLTLY